jgi:hypothetical protein
MYACAGLPGRVHLFAARRRTVVTCLRGEVMETVELIRDGRSYDMLVEQVTTYNIAMVFGVSRQALYAVLKHASHSFFFSFLFPA